MSNYFKTKPIDRLIRKSNGGDVGSSHLKRVLGPHHLVTLGDTWIRLVVWPVLGLFIYLFYGIKHSRL